MKRSMLASSLLHMMPVNPARIGDRAASAYGGQCAVCPTPAAARRRQRLYAILGACLLVSLAAPPAARSAPGEFGVGRPARLGDLPAAAAIRNDLERLPAPARARGLRWLQSFHFTDLDLPALRADAAGGIFYVCDFGAATVPSESEPPTVGAATVPVSPFPSHLIFHSRPGAPNVLYLNFMGENVTNTEWNSVVGRSEIPALIFSTDSDRTTFSDAEQAAIKRIWQRVAEDYAPFDIDVTTERPVVLGIRTAHALITRSTDANGDPNPYSYAGGVAYVNVFGTTSYPTYRPAWIYHDNLSNNESYIAEAASHEVGHNMGLSHDGKTDGTEYYSGHGSGDISWGPVMGTGYNRNVTQWCKGEYYLANNAQDDLATIAGKTSYRADDHGNTPGTATALAVSEGGILLSTTPEDDPDNTNTANKGVLERATDVDVFSFVTGSGSVWLSVNPWIVPSGTRGGNLDVLIEIYDDAGARVLTNNPALQTTAMVFTTLAEGRYYLHVRNSGAGDPFSSTPSGYTSYGSLGQYFVTGSVTETTGFTIPPVAELQATNLTESGQTMKQFAVVYSDDVAIDTSTVDSDDIRVTGPNGYEQAAAFVSLDTAGNGTPRMATYALTPPGGGIWSSVDNGTYTVWMQAEQVGDTEGAWVAAGELGGFQVVVPVTIYSADMDVDPGWTLEPDWQYGAPAYAGEGPSGGFTGTHIVGYILDGSYPNRLDTRYATTPAIDCSGSASVTLRFRRWLRTEDRDTASIELSTEGTTWVDVWSTSGAVSDDSWQEVQYALPEVAAGSSAVRMRWGLSSNPSKNDIGWNIDDVELLGDGSLDTIPPEAALTVADLAVGGSPTHSCSVTYTDATAVRLSSLDSADLLVTGPNAYSNLAEFVGADLPDDGSPIAATYSIPAPNVVWAAADNGTYTVTLLEGAVEDTENNATPQTVLSGFEVAISAPGLLEVTPGEGLNSEGSQGGPFDPSSIAYTLANSGESPIDWSASTSEEWVSLSATGGSLQPSASTNVTASINAQAETLAPGIYPATISFTVVNGGAGDTTRTVTLTVDALATFDLVAAVNNPAWGSVDPTNGTYTAGSVVDVLATPATYFQFDEWTGDASGTDNPLELVMETNVTVQAAFSETLTTNDPTPYWWLAEYGYTNDFETAVTLIGANGMALWESYVAGLDPTDPESRLVLTVELAAEGGSHVLTWDPVDGRLYTIWESTDLLDGFAPLPDAIDLPVTVRSYTREINEAVPGQFYLLDVRKP